MAKKRYELKDSGVIFNEEEHTYLLGDKYLSGITGMLHRQFGYAYENVPKNVLEEARIYGTNLHRELEEYDSMWISTGSVECEDYRRICEENGLRHIASEYCVSDGKDWASMVDKCYLGESANIFDLADIKSYGQMTAEKLEKARWQLSIYAFLFELQNKGAKVGRLFVIHLRNKQKKDGTWDHISNIIFVNRIPSDICEDLLATDLRGEQFVNPYAIPDDISSQEAIIRELIQKKSEIDEALSGIKAKILRDMEAKDVRIWATDTMRLTRKLPSQRSSFNLALFKQDHPDLKYDDYMRTSEVAGSLLIAV